MLKKIVKKVPFLVPYAIDAIANLSYELFYSTSSKNQISKITLADIEGFLQEAGVNKGGCIFIHSSWSKINSEKFTAPELIKALINYVGEDGTLAMPAFPQNQDTNQIFNVKRTPSGAGLLTEVFRRFPGVQRSINLNHSVCAIGKKAEFLVGEHHLSETSWDVNSPYYKLGQLDNAWVVGLGVGHRLAVATSLHCVESALYKENEFYKKIFTKKVNYKFMDNNGNEGEHSFLKREGIIYTPKIAKYFTDQELIEKTISGVDLYAIKANTLIDKSIRLGKRGKTMYIYPYPFKKYFENR